MTVSNHNRDGAGRCRAVSLAFALLLTLAFLLHTTDTHTTTTSAGSWFIPAVSASSDDATGTTLTTTAATSGGDGHVTAPPPSSPKQQATITNAGSSSGGGGARKDSKKTSTIRNKSNAAHAPSTTATTTAASAGVAPVDCLTLVGPRTRTLGGVDQSIVSRHFSSPSSLSSLPNGDVGDGPATTTTAAATSAAASVLIPSDGIVRDLSQAVELTCRLYYRQRSAITKREDRAITQLLSNHDGGGERKQGGSFLSSFFFSPPSPSSSPASAARHLRRYTAVDLSVYFGDAFFIINDDDDDDGHGVATTTTAPAMRVSFPPRYSPMDKQMTSRATVRGTGAVSYLDILFGVPEVSQQSPLRRRGHLRFLEQKDQEEEEHQQQGHTHGNNDDDDDDDDKNKNINKRRRNGKSTTTTTASSSTASALTFFTARAYEALKARTFTLLSEFGAAIGHYPFHRPAALQRLFAARTLRISFPLGEKQRRCVSTIVKSKNINHDINEDDQTEEFEKEQEEEEVLLPSSSSASLLPAASNNPRAVSRAELLSQGSLARLRIVSFPPVPRGGGDISGNSDGSSRLLEKILVCDFKAALQAAAHIRDVDRQAQQHREEARMRERMMGGVKSRNNDYDDDDDDDIEDIEDDDDIGGALDVDEDGAGDEKELRRLIQKRTGRRRQGSSSSSSRKRGPPSSAAAARRTSGGSLIGSLLSSSSTKTRNNKKRSGASSFLSFFPMYSWAFTKVRDALFGSKYSRVHHHRLPSYYSAQQYVAVVSEELGPFQPSALSFSSDYVRHLIGQRALFTSQRLVHTTTTTTATDSDSDSDAASDDTDHRNSKCTTLVTEREMFVWGATLPATETLCIALIALPHLSPRSPPPSSATTSSSPKSRTNNINVNVNDPDDGGAFFLPVEMHETLSFDYFWLKAFACAFVFHVYVKRHLEGNRAVTFIFASLCGLLTLLFVFFFYLLREIRKMSVGRMGLYFFLFFGGVTAVMEGCASVAGLAIQQMIDVLDAQESGLGLLSFLFSFGGGGGAGNTITSDNNDDQDDDAAVLERLEAASRQNAVTLLAVIAVATLALGIVSSLIVRCFVSDYYLRAGTRLSINALLTLSWCFVFAVNREATAAALLVYALALLCRRPGRRVVAAAVATVSRASASSCRDNKNKPATATAVDTTGRHSSSYNEADDDNEPLDSFPPEASRFVPRVAPLAAEGTMFHSNRGGGSNGNNGDYDDEEEEERISYSRRGGGGGHRGRGSASLSHAEAMRRYEETGTDHTRRALDELAQLIRDNPEKYAGRLRDPNSVYRWAGVGEDDDDNEDDDDDDDDGDE